MTDARTRRGKLPAISAIAAILAAACAPVAAQDADPVPPVPAPAPPVLSAPPEDVPALELPEVDLSEEGLAAYRMRKEERLADLGHSDPKVRRKAFAYLFAYREADDAGLRARVEKDRAAALEACRAAYAAALDADGNRKNLAKLKQAGKDMISRVKRGKLGDEAKALYDEMKSLYYGIPEGIDKARPVKEAVANLRELAYWLTLLGGDAGDDAAALQAMLAEENTKAIERRIPEADRTRAAANVEAKEKLDPEEWRLVEITNEYRLLHGFNVMQIDVALCEAARMHSKDMAENNFFSHASPLAGKKTPQDRAALHGATCRSENIYQGSEKGEEAFWGWFQSEGHHKNMLGVNGKIGIGRHGRFWTENF